MSTRAIAPVVGVNQATVVRDVMHRASPERIDHATGEVVTEQSASVTGLDGKNYARPEPKAPKRTPLRDGFRDAALPEAREIGGALRTAEPPT